MVIAFLMVICSVMGIPFYVAGVNEQRITNVVAHILVGLTVVLTPLIKLVPMPVLLGVFLYMGVVSLIGVQFIQRLSILFMPNKYQPDYPFLRLVRIGRVHLFTMIQLGAIIALFVVKYIKIISMIFPLMLVVTVGMRMAMKWLFTPVELNALDDPLPPLKYIFATKKAQAAQAQIRLPESRLSEKALYVKSDDSLVAHSLLIHADKADNNGHQV